MSSNQNYETQKYNSLHPIYAREYHKQYNISHPLIRPCLFEGCPNDAVSTHIISKKKYLVPVSDKDGRIYENRFFPTDDEQKMKRFNCSKAFEFKGFCNTHDTMFSNIDNGNVDYYDYKTQLLLCYRAYFYEIRKMEVALECNDIAVKKTGIVLRSSHKDRLARFKQSVGEIQVYKRFLDDDLISKNKFNFYVYELPYVELLSCAHFKIRTRKQGNITIYQVILPEKTLGKTILLQGYIRFSGDEPVSRQFEKMKSWSPNLFLKHISDTFLLATETWGMSTAFHSEAFKGAMESELSALKKNLKVHPNTNGIIDQNMFLRIDLEQNLPVVNLPSWVSIKPKYEPFLNAIGRAYS